MKNQEKKKLVDLVFTKEAMHDAAEYANFSQSFKMLMWERGFSGEEKMEEIAMILWESYMNQGYADRNSPKDDPHLSFRWKKPLPKKI